MDLTLDAIIASIPEESEREPEACAHRRYDLIPARNEWGEPQLWCKCGHVMECKPATLCNERGRIETGGNLRLWADLSAHNIALRIIGERR